MIRYCAVCMGIFLVPFWMLGQEIETVTCATDEVDAYYSKLYPEKESVEAFENWMREAKERMYREQVVREVLTIPVIFHLIGNGEDIGQGANATQARIMEQIDVLNEDFRRMAGTSGFNEDGVDTEIEFCPAYIDPTGLPLDEPGIDRVNGLARGFPNGPYTSGVLGSTIQPNTFWDPERYMNVWVVNGITSTNSTGRVAGYAFLPQSNVLNGLPGSSVIAAIDGIVVDIAFVGRGNSDATLTHEVGHFLGLRHILGGSLNGVDGDIRCNSDDFCDDTPLTSGENQGCNVGLATSCGSVDPLENFMMATVGFCRNTFTECQKGRMRTVLSNSFRRASLVNSTVCQLPTAAPVSNFRLTNTFSCDGTFEFQDESENFPSNWFWIFSNGKVDSVRNPRIQFDRSGTYSATLIANNFLGTSVPFTQTFDVEVDIEALDAGEDVFVCQGLDENTIKLNAFYIGNPNVQFSWRPGGELDNPNILTPNVTVTRSQIFTLSARTNNGCVVEDEVDVRIAPQPTTFALGGATIGLGDTIQLNALGAERFVWSPDSSLSDPNIPNPLAFPQETTWYSVVGTNGENCSKTDSVRVEVTTTSLEDLAKLGRQIFSPFPNPSEGFVNFSAQFDKGGELSIELWDLRGKPLLSIFEGEISSGSFSSKWDVHPQLSKGMYFVVWKMDGPSHVQRIVIQ